MNKNIIMAGVIIAMSAAMVGSYVHKNKKQTTTNEKKPVTNWIWSDEWTGKPKDDGKPKENTPYQDPNVPPPAPMPVTPPTNPPGATTAQTYADAVKLSGEQGRPVLVMFTADWCSWCQKMKNNVLPDPTVAAMMKNYIYVAVNTDQNAELTKKYGISGIPAFLITNGKEDKLKFIASYMEPNAFVTWLNDSSLFNQPKLDKPATPPTTPKPPSTPDDKPKKPKRPKK